MKKPKPEMKTKATSLLLLIASLSGCATMNAKECAYANWQAIGYEDGSQGHGLEKFTERRRDYAEHGITANFATYKPGYDQGVKSYCTLQRGYNLGKANQSLPNICPSDLAAKMRRSYVLGQKLYAEKHPLMQKMNGLKADIKKFDKKTKTLKGELEEHKRYLEIAENGLKKPNKQSSEELVYYTQRAQLQKLISEKEQEINRLKKRKKTISDAINKLQADINRIDSRPMPALR